MYLYYTYVVGFHPFFGALACPNSTLLMHWTPEIWYFDAARNCKCVDPKLLFRKESWKPLPRWVSNAHQRLNDYNIQRFIETAIYNHEFGNVNFTFPNSWFWHQDQIWLLECVPNEWLCYGCHTKGTLTRLRAMKSRERLQIWDAHPESVEKDRFSC